MQHETESGFITMAINKSGSLLKYQCHFEVLLWGGLDVCPKP